MPTSDAQVTSQSMRGPRMKWGWITAIAFLLEFMANADDAARRNAYRLQRAWLQGDARYLRNVSESGRAFCEFDLIGKTVERLSWHRDYLFSLMFQCCVCHFWNDWEFISTKSKIKRHINRVALELASHRKDLFRQKFKASAWPDDLAIAALA